MAAHSHPLLPPIHPPSCAIEDQCQDHHKQQPQGLEAAPLLLLLQSAPVAFP